MLIPFWFRLDKNFGYGVTAASQDDAETLLRTFGYPRDGEVVMEVVHNVKFSDLNQDHVVPNAGPMVFRGVWYPRHNLEGQ